MSDLACQVGAVRTHRMRTKHLRSGAKLKKRCILVGSADNALMCCSVVALEGVVAEGWLRKRF
ncbi:hypothetical protein, partial [Variovorax boronicumulans]|uniref:hypothetical protein n=1 Tax=Variovorax boronicumulans TaxID=436515 RepID=UPI0027D7BC24